MGKTFTDEIEDSLFDEIQDRDSLPESTLEAIRAIAELYSVNFKFARKVERGLLDLIREFEK